jgi:hypothetical protein
MSGISKQDMLSLTYPQIVSIWNTLEDIKEETTTKKEQSQLGIVYTTPATMAEMQKQYREEYKEKHGVYPSKD